jgi:hypothetical protein
VRYCNGCPFIDLLCCPNPNPGQRMLEPAKTRCPLSLFPSRCASTSHLNYTSHGNTRWKPVSTCVGTSPRGSSGLWCHHSSSLRCLSPSSSLELAQVFLFLPTRNRRVRSPSSAVQDLLTVHRRSTSLMSLALSYQSDNRRASSSHAGQPPALLCSTAASDTNQDHAGCRSSLGRSLVQHGQAEPIGP